MIYAHSSSTPKHKKSRPQLRQAISLTIQSVFFPMMFPIGTGRRKSDLLPHRAHAVALIWKMISVLLEPINIILVSPVNDTFLPSIVDLTEEEMRFRGRTREEEEERKRGGILQGLAYDKGVLHPSNCFLTSKTYSASSSFTHAHTQKYKQLIILPIIQELELHGSLNTTTPQIPKKQTDRKNNNSPLESRAESKKAFSPLSISSCQPDSKHTMFGSGAQSRLTTIVSYSPHIFLLVVAANIAAPLLLL